MRNKPEPLLPALLVLLTLSLSFVSPMRAAESSTISPEVYRPLAFRYIGPAGNRVSAVTGVPGNPFVYYAGSASGGIFKSSDAGITWQPIFDAQPVSSIGSLAVDPSNPNVVWAGTGEPWSRSHISIGVGIYKSTDAGKTWKSMGLEKTGRIARIVSDPQHPDRVFAAAMGHNYGPKEERGVSRTTDGGESWSRVLFVDENTGCSDIVMSPGNPQVLVAGMWQFVIHTWGQMSGGPGSGMFMSRNGGATWNRVSGHGLPDQEVGKIGLAISMPQVPPEPSSGAGSAYDPVPSAVLHTSPIYATWLKAPEKGRPVGGRMSLLASPGKYTVKLSVGGQDYTQPLVLIKDPHSAGTEADIRAQFAFLETVEQNANNVDDMIDRAELLRQQVSGLENASADQVKTAANGVYEKLTDFEQNLYQLRITGGQDGMRWPAKLQEKLGHLASELEDADYAPTSQQIAVNRQYTEEIRNLQGRLRQLMTRDVAGFNRLLKQQKIPLMPWLAGQRRTACNESSLGPGCFT